MENDKYYLCSGYMLNCIFGTRHNKHDKLWILTPTGFVEYEIFKKEFLQLTEKQE